MTQGMTDQEMLRQIQEAISSSVGNYDADAILQDLMNEFGLVHLDEIPTDVFWTTVLVHCTDAGLDEYIVKSSIERFHAVTPEQDAEMQRGYDLYADESIDDSAGYLNCGCHGSQRDHTCEPPF